MFIGDNVLLVVNVGFYTVGHLFDVDLRNQVREEIKPVVIGHRRATQRWCVKIIDAGRVTCQEYVDSVYVDLKK